VILGIILLVIFSSTSYRILNTAASPPVARTPIQHIVIIMQENHAFDNMFGTFPGLPTGFSENLTICMPDTTTQKSPTPCIKPWNANAKQSTVQGHDISHTRTSALKAYDNGKMNGFVQNAPTCCKNYTMAYYNGTVLPYYWDYAQYYTLNYQMMSSALSFSLPNHLYAVAGAAGYAATCINICSTEYNLDFPQIGETLTNAGLSWGYYQQNWNDKIDCTGQYVRGITKFSTGGGYDGLWSGLADFTQVQKTAIECSSLGNLQDFKNAISADDLPAVSWVEPQPQNSDHPGQGTWSAGQIYVSSIINSIEQSPEWNSTVIFLTWDDWGGYYDNIVPIQLDKAGEGMRVPLIAISPYSIPSGIVEAPAYTFNCSVNCTSTNTFTYIHQEDFSSLLSTIEYNWNLTSLTDRDAQEPNLFYMLNFTQPLLKPLILSTTGVTYPVQTCTGCAIASFSTANHVASFITPPPNSPINESASQALNYSGDADAGD
jgi:phospholipase C